jgi:EMC6-arch
MSEEQTGEMPVQSRKTRTRADKQAEHIGRIQRTLIACFIGMFTGILAFYLGGVPDVAGLQNDGFLGVMLMLAGIVAQKHLFILIGMDTSRLGGKDWFYQGFMTFAFWLMSWAILLTVCVGTGPIYTANATSGTAPLTVQFNDTSANPLTSWNWSFTDVTGNNTPVLWSTEQNTTQTFGAGNFSIALYAGNSGGHNFAREIMFVNVTTPAVPPVTR